MNPYQVLYVSRFSSPEHIDASYTKLTLFLHRYKPISHEERQRRVDTVTVAYKKLRPMIPRQAAWAHMSVHDAHQHMIANADDTTRTFWLIVEQE